MGHFFGNYHRDLHHAGNMPFAAPRGLIDHFSQAVFRDGVGVAFAGGGQVAKLGRILSRELCEWHSNRFLPIRSPCEANTSRARSFINRIIPSASHTVTAQLTSAAHCKSDGIINKSGLIFVVRKRLNVCCYKNSEKRVCCAISVVNY